MQQNDAGVTALCNSKGEHHEWSRLQARKLPLTCSSPKNTDGRHRGCRAAVTNSQERVRRYPFAGPSERKVNASSGSIGIACRAGINATDVRSLDTSVEWPPQHRVKLQLVTAILLGGLVLVSVFVGPSFADDRFVLYCGRGGGSYNNLAGEVLEQSCWLHAVRARIAAPSNDTAGKGKVIGFFVVSEELDPFVRSGSRRKIHSHTHSSACSVNAGRSEAREAGPKSTQVCRAPKDRTSGSVQETPELR